MTLPSPTHPIPLTPKHSSSAPCPDMIPPVALSAQMISRILGWARRALGRSLLSLLQSVVETDGQRVCLASAQNPPATTGSQLPVSVTPAQSAPPPPPPPPNPAQWPINPQDLPAAVARSLQLRRDTQEDHVLRLWIRLLRPVLHRVHRVLRLRRSWAHLGAHLQALPPPAVPRNDWQGYRGRLPRHR